MNHACTITLGILIGFGALFLIDVVLLALWDLVIRRQARP